MGRYLVKWFITTLGIMIVPQLVHGVHVQGWWAALLAAVVLGILNVILWPVLVILTLPLTLLTFGSFLLVINGVLFAIAGKLVPRRLRWIRSGRLLPQESSSALYRGRQTACFPWTGLPAAAWWRGDTKSIIPETETIDLHRNSAGNGSRPDRDACELYRISEVITDSPAAGMPACPAVCLHSEYTSENHCGFVPAPSRGGNPGNYNTPRLLVYGNQVIVLSQHVIEPWGGVRMRGRIVY